jgi:radical SAM-linked protein
MRFLSHLELLTVFTRAVSRGNVPILFSQGFHPHPRFSFATATSVGVESLAEYMDMFVSPGITAEEIMQRLNQALPRGLRILEAQLIEPKSPSLSTLINGTRYRITLGESWSGKLDELCGTFLERDSFVMQRKKKGNVQSIDLRQELIELTPCGSALELTARRGKALEFVHAITGDSSLGGDDMRVEKLEVIFSA